MRGKGRLDSSRQEAHLVHLGCLRLESQRLCQALHRLGHVHLASLGPLPQVEERPATRCRRT